MLMNAWLELISAIKPAPIMLHLTPVAVNQAIGLMKMV
jgi:hypothetical protein